MRKLLIIFLCSLSLAGVAQTRPKWILTVGEYTTPASDSAGRFVFFSGAPALTGNSGGGTAGIATAISTPGTTFVATYNTLHGGGGIDQTAHAWYAGNNDEGQSGLGGISANIGTFTKITVDSLGNDFAPILMAQGFFYQNGGTLAQGTYFVKQGISEDSIFACGLTNFGLALNGTAGGQWTRPVFVYTRPGHHIKEITAEKATCILFDDGELGTAGGNGDFTLLGYAGTGTQYQSVHVFSPFTAGEVIKHIAGGDLMGFVAIGTIKQLWGCGKHSEYLGNASDVSYTTWHDLTDSVSSYILNGTSRTSITAVVGNSNCFHVLANDSSCWFWGDNGMGSGGNGVQPNMATIPFPYFVDPAQLAVLQQIHPVRVTNKHNFTNIYGGCLFTFLFFALDANGVLYAAGRNKGTVVPNGIVSCENFGDMASAYPNSWQLPNLTPLDPYGVTTVITQGCEGCKLGVVTTDCGDAGCAPPTTTPTAAIVGGNSVTTSATAINVDGSASTCTGGKLVTYTWASTDGVIDAVAGKKINWSGLSVGTHTAILTVKDNGFNTSSVTFTATITSGGVTPCNCISNIKKPVNAH